VHVALEGDKTRFADWMMTEACNATVPWGILPIERAVDLLKEEIKPLEWLVDNLVPAEGTTLLAGPPKIGKSWLALWLAVGCAWEGTLLGRPVKKTGVIYFALEDNKRRYQQRLNMVLCGRPCPRNLYQAYTLPKMAEDLCAKLEATLNFYGDVGLVIIDTLAIIRDRQVGKGLAEFDHETLFPLSELARRRRIAIVIVSHNRKTPGGGVQEIVAGSHAITATVDSGIVLTVIEDQEAVRLRTFGKDNETEEDMRIHFDKHTYEWKAEGNYEGPSDEDDLELKIVAYMVRMDGPQTPSMIADALEVEQQDRVDRRLKHLVKKGVLTHHEKRGYYDLKRAWADASPDWT